ncbi:hypothetical protein GN956_G15238 [Arapaima gigas]
MHNLPKIESSVLNCGEIEPQTPAPRALPIGPAQGRRNCRQRPSRLTVSRVVYFPLHRRSLRQASSSRAGPPPVRHVAPERGFCCSLSSPAGKATTVTTQGASDSVFLNRFGLTDVPR